MLLECIILELVHLACSQHRHAYMHAYYPPTSYSPYYNYHPYPPSPYYPEYRGPYYYPRPPTNFIVKFRLPMHRPPVEAEPTTAEQVIPEINSTTPCTACCPPPEESCSACDSMSNSGSVCGENSGLENNANVAKTCPCAGNEPSSSENVPAGPSGPCDDGCVCPEGGQSQRSSAEQDTEADECPQDVGASGLDIETTSESNGIPVENEELQKTEDSRRFSPKLITPMIIEYVGPHSSIVENIGGYRRNALRTNENSTDSTTGPSGAAQNMCQALTKEEVPVSGPVLMEKRPDGGEDQDEVENSDRAGSCECESCRHKPKLSIQALKAFEEKLESILDENDKVQEEAPEAEAQDGPVLVSENIQHSNIPEHLPTDNPESNHAESIDANLV